MANGIDSAYDEEHIIKTIDPKILGLAFLVTTFIAKYRNELSETYCDMIKDAAENIYDPTHHISLAKYATYVLDMTFSYAGRSHYDELREIVGKFICENS